MIQIPYFAWSGEISADYHERTRIVTYQTVGGTVGLLLVLLVLLSPTITDHLYSGDGARKLGAMGGIILVTLLPGVWLTLRAFPEPRVAALPSHATAPSPLQSFRLIASDGVLMWVLASDFAMTMRQLMRGALFVFFVNSYMGLPAWSSGLLLFQFLFGIVAGPLWMLVGRRFGKHRTAIAEKIVRRFFSRPSAYR